MSTPPKATKFRIRKVVAPAPAKPAVAEDMPFAAAAADDGFEDLKIADTDPAPETPLPDANALEDEAALEAIRAEGLTGRQLRMARRVALRHGIDAATDYEAVLFLRRRNIDPFQRVNVVDLIPADPQETALQPYKAPLPPAAGKVILPPAAPSPEAERARAIMQMQRDIVRRRQRNFGLLVVRLLFFVFLPTIFAGYYYYKVATPLYATKTEFQIQKADGLGGGAGGLFSGTQFATSQDAIAVQGYLQSREAMVRLDEALGYKAHFAQDFIDPLQRLDPGATNEQAYKLYKRNLKISFDPTEGLIRMEVVAADPASSQKFADALLGFAEDRVDALTQKVREDQMKGAHDSYADAETKVRAAEAKVLELQEQLGVLDPAAESTVVMNQVAELEGELRLKELELGQLQANAKPNKARVEGVKGDMARLQVQIDQLRSSMTGGATGNLSLAQITGQLRIAETELQTRQLMLSKALEHQEVARIEANRQVRYLSLSVAPTAPDEATYPRKFENTALAFLVFAGIYMMLSLTASILREQVTA